MQIICNNYEKCDQEHYYCPALTFEHNLQYMLKLRRVEWDEQPQIDLLPTYEKERREDLKHNIDHTANSIPIAWLAKSYR